ncbi:MAG: hypothetical protein DRH37_02500, partial [Deltaproteobacteria bacterium]
MAWNPISGTFIQYGEDDVDASGFYLKFYASGTTAPISMADDSGGGTLLAKCALDSDGMPVNGSSAPFIPHVDQQYKIVIYRNSTDADADTIANAYKVIDELYPSLSSVTEATSNVVYGTVALAKAATFTSGKLANTKGYTTSGDGGGATYLVKTTAAYSGTPDGYGDHATDDGDFVLVLQIAGVANIRTFGAIADFTTVKTDNYGAMQAALDAARAVYVPTGDYGYDGELVVGTGKFYGDGQQNTKLHAVDATDGVKLRVGSGAVLEGIKLFGPWSASVDVGTLNIGVSDLTGIGPLAG